MIWRVPCKIYPYFSRVHSDFSRVLTWFFFWFTLWNPAFSQVATRKNLRCFCHPEKNRVDFTGYPSNHFSGCRLNGRIRACLNFVHHLIYRATSQAELAFEGSFHLSFLIYSCTKQPINVNGEQHNNKKQSSCLHNFCLANFSLQFQQQKLSKMLL